jgi:hypothetical protein
MDLFTPQEFKDAVITSFSAVKLGCHTAINCVFSELMAVFDWTKWFAGQGKDMWPNKISNFRTREETVHSSRFQRRVVAREDRP